MTATTNSPERYCNSDRPLTDDSLFAGELICRQYEDGYRFSVDSILAAHFCRLRGTKQVLDLGCGSGVIGLILARLHPGIELVGLELQQDLAGLAAMNFLANNLDTRCRVVYGDARQIGSFVDAESFDLVVCNPPYRRTGSGRISRASEAAIARHELKANLDDMLAAAAFSVINKGQVVFVYPAVRLASLVAGMHHHRLIPRRLQPVYSYPEADQATLVVMEGVKNGGEGCSLLPPLYIYAGKNMGYSPEMEKLYTAMPCGNDAKGQGAV